MKRFLEIYQELNRDNLHLLESIYAKDIRFFDPAHEITGLIHLNEYFSSLYENLSSISFDFHDELQVGQDAYVQWNMRFIHRKLAAGQPITVNGATFLQFDEKNKVFYHRDFFDLGAMVYEQVPLLGRVITSLKNRLGK